ncbi:PIN domain-containing protein [Fibrella arboris]|uniref:PIN domain-containing protein n=1 Tax=Fibrella arboris TaxID=3242486 RepID=UPI003521D3ED
MSEPIILQTVKLRRHYKGLKLPDAIMAATAIAHDFTLLSTNDSDFNKITDLRYRSLTA